MNKKKVLVIMLIFVINLLFIANVGADTYDNYKNAVVSCGAGYVSNIPSLLPKVISIAYTVIQIAVPVVLVIMGAMDLFKGVMAQKEDEIKKSQQLFIKRLIAAAVVFFVFVIVKFVISAVADNSSSKIIECTKCFIENKCD